MAIAGGCVCRFLQHGCKVDTVSGQNKFLYSIRIVVIRVRIFQVVQDGRRQSEVAAVFPKLTRRQHRDIKS